MPTNHRRHTRTDRQTDRPTDRQHNTAIPHFVLRASCGKKTVSPFTLALGKLFRPNSTNFILEVIIILYLGLSRWFVTLTSHLSTLQVLCHWLTFSENYINNNTTIMYRRKGGCIAFFRSDTIFATSKTCIMYWRHTLARYTRKQSDKKFKRGQKTLRKIGTLGHIPLRSETTVNEVRRALSSTSASRLHCFRQCLRCDENSDDGNVRYLG